MGDNEIERNFCLKTWGLNGDFNDFGAFMKLLKVWGSCSNLGNLEFYKNSGQNVILESFKVKI